MPEDEFRKRGVRFIAAMGGDEELRALTQAWFVAASRHEYSYHFSWLGRPIIQFPQDIVAVQEIIWQVKPHAIVETGIARGGSLVFHASMLELLGDDGIVVGIDCEIRPHNRQAIESHSLLPRIRMLEGSSTDPKIVRQVRKLAKNRQPVLVILDSNHTHEHVLAELKLYSGLVTHGSYLVVLDTIIEDLPADFFPDRPWGPGNSPKTAVAEFLADNDRFEVDRAMENKLLITTAPGGFLKCVKD